MTEQRAPIVVKPGTVSLDDLVRVLEGHSVLLDPAFWPRVDAAAEIVAEAARADAPVYGINTGFGKLASKRIPPDQTALLQRNLIVSHCCGVGMATPEPIARLMMALKIISLGRGASGVRREVIEQLQTMLARRVSPLVPQQGSVGASGDLAPLAHMTAVMIGEGQAIVDGKIVSGSDALAAVGLTPLTLGPKEGLALINGTQFSTAYAVSGVLRAFRLARAALVTGALSVDAAMASTAPFRPEIQVLRGHSGQIAAAASLMALLDGSDIRLSHLEGDERVQDPYCLRCQPQVAGAALDLIVQAARMLMSRPMRSPTIRSCWSRPARSFPAAISMPNRWPLPPITSRWRCRKSVRSASGASRRWSIPRSISACRRSSRRSPASIPAS